MEARIRNIVEYRKSITTDELDTYAELVMKIENLPDEKVEKLRKQFLDLYEEMEEAVRKETEISERMGKETQEADAEEPRQPRKVMKYKNGRTYFEDE